MKLTLFLLILSITAILSKDCDESCHKLRNLLYMKRNQSIYNINFPNESCHKLRKLRDLLYMKRNQSIYNINFPDEKVQYEHLWYGYGWFNHPKPEMPEICVLSDREYAQLVELYIIYIKYILHIIEVFIMYVIPIFILMYIIKNF